MKKQILAVLFCGLVVFVACKRDNHTSGATDREGGGAFGHSANEQYNDSLNKPGAAPLTGNTSNPASGTNQPPSK